MEDKEKFDYLNGAICQEANLYWIRFTAFSAMHAGLFVIASSNSNTKPNYYEFFGLLIGLIWCYIQWVGRRYINCHKAEFTKLLKQFELYQEPVPINASAIGIVVAIIVSVFWMGVIIFNWGH